MNIIVLGAYGFTGKLVCQELLAANIAFTAAGRDESALMELCTELNTNLDTTIIDLLEENQVKSLVKQFDLFINCVGPFAEMAHLLLQYLALTNKTYFDISGESIFVHNSHSKYHQQSINNKATLLHSCAFESVLAELVGASIMQNQSDIDTINTYYFMGKAKPSPGTRLTMKLSIFNRPEFLVNGIKRPITQIDKKEVSWTGIEPMVAIPYPLPEVCFFEWNTNAKSIGSFLLLDPTEAKYLNHSSPINKTKEEVIATFRARKPKGPKEKQRQDQQFILIVEIKNTANEVQTVQLKGSDMYLLTAQIIVYFTQKVIAGTRNKAYGVITPSQFLGPNHDFFKTLRIEKTSL